MRLLRLIVFPGTMLWQTATLLRSQPLARLGFLGDIIFNISTSQHSNRLPHMKMTAWLSRHWKNLKNIKESPHAVAVGVASGMFFGFTPLMGLKTLLAVGIAWAFGGSVIAAAIAVTLHDLLLPLMPVLLRWEYVLGFWVLSEPHGFPPALSLHSGESPGTWLTWSTFLTIGRPVLVGSLFFSVPFSCLSYFGMRCFLERRKGRQPDLDRP